MSNDTGGTDMSETPMLLKTGLAEMLKGGVIMDVTTADQAKLPKRLAPWR